MIDDPFENRLRAWGLAYGLRPEADVAEEREPEGVSATARITVDGTRRSQVASWRREGALYSRSGTMRRRIQQQVGDTCPVPAWAGGDPIRAPSQRRYGSAAPVEVGLDAEEIERLVLSLQAFDRRAALALRACYCLLGRRPLNERIAWVAEKSETKVSRAGYSAAIARGRLQVKTALTKGVRKIG